MTIPRILVSATLLFLAMSHETDAVNVRDKIEMSNEVIVNPLDESPRTGCKSSTKVGAQSQEWWMTFATARPHEEKVWEVSDKKVRCGSGSFDRGALDFKASSGAPYLISRISTNVRLHPSTLIPDKVLRLDITLSLQKLSGFGTEDNPVYGESVEKRTFFFFDRGNAFIPLFIANSYEQEALRVHEVFLRVAMRMERADSATAYGVISITSGKEGGKLLLDGGVVGNISASSEMTIRNVPVGLREVQLQDSSGNDIGKVVRVIANRMVLVDLNLPDPRQKSFYFRLKSLGKNVQGYEEYHRESDSAVVVKIPAGEFLMGNKETERSPLEHRVYVSEFMMDKTGVTWGQYKRFAEATGIPLPAQKPYWGIHDDHPAVYVTWEDAKAYCEWAGARLPTEAEREKAARGVDGRKYPWGNEEPDPQRAVFRRSWGKEATAAVGTHPSGASPYGLQDMGGNVWEWSSDWYDDSYYEVSPYQDPKGPSSGRAHVVRGGSWDSRPDVLSSSCRSWGSLGYREGDFGFRCAMNVMNVSR
jgi:formylglycine-generating enzyme required for sulfatase activity